MLLKFALPKGSLQEATFNLLAKAGYQFSARNRSYSPVCDDPEITARLLRAQEIARYVSLGVFDLGITGYDWVIENDADVVEVCELSYSKASRKPSRWVLAVPNQSDIQTAQDLAGKRIATELVNATKKYLASHNVSADVEFSWGATEVKVPDLVDAIVELTETGSSLKANKLRIVDTILTTTTRLIANKKSMDDPAIRQKIESIAMLLKGALEAYGMVGLKMNVSEKDLDNLLAIIPAMKEPTINHLKDRAWLAVEIILKEADVRSLIPDLKRAGACDIIEYPLNKVIP